MKTCHVCLKEKHIDNFYPNITCKDGYNNMCRGCCRLYSQYKREKARETNRGKLKEKIWYGSTLSSPPDPSHQITIDTTPTTVRFD